MISSQFVAYMTTDAEPAEPEPSAGHVLVDPGAFSLEPSGRLVIDGVQYFVVSRSDRFTSRRNEDIGVSLNNRLRRVQVGNAAREWRGDVFFTSRAELDAALEELQGFVTVSGEVLSGLCIAQTQDFRPVGLDYWILTLELRAQA